MCLSVLLQWHHPFVNTIIITIIQLYLIIVHHLLMSQSTHPNLHLNLIDLNENNSHQNINSITLNQHNNNSHNTNHILSCQEVQEGKDNNHYDSQQSNRDNINQVQIISALHQIIYLSEWIIIIHLVHLFDIRYSKKLRKPSNNFLIMFVIINVQ